MKALLKKVVLSGLAGLAGFAGLAGLVAFCGLTQTAMADGMIVPVRPDLPVRGSWSVEYHHVDIMVRQQAASVSIDQKFVNNGSGMIEVEYLFPVPPGAAIDSMTLIVDGQEMVAKLLPADEARKIYEDIVRRKKDPALMEYAGFGLYRTRAFPLEPGKPARVQVHYDYIPKKDANLVELWYPLNTEKFSARPISDVKVRADIKTTADISSVYSPTHDLKVERKDARHVIASYQGENIIPTTDFQVFYRTANEDVSATLITYSPTDSNEGYFLALLSPNPKNTATKALAKDIVIVIDRSGSMSGEKIVQARESARFILNNLNPEDRYNVISYSDSTESFHQQLSSVSQTVLADDIERVEAITAGGGTNIHDALQAAMEMFAESSRPSYVIFLTDGRATTGKTSEKDITANTARANKASARLFAFGVGYNVNVSLLDKLVGQNHGRSDYVKPNENIESKISSLYAKIKNPVMTELKIEYPFEVTETYPRELDDLFEGDQIVLVGRVKNAGPLKANRANASGQMVLTGLYMGQQRGFEYSVNTQMTSQSRFAFVERLWAMRRVGWLLDQIQLNGENEELVQELISLSTRYGIITPYTSFLAEEKTNMADSAGMIRRGRAAGETLNSDKTGFAGQRAAKMRQSFNTSSRPAPAPALGGGVEMIGKKNQADYESSRTEIVQTVRQADNMTSYLKSGNIWVASNAIDIDIEKDIDKAEAVERYSDRYFELTRQNSVSENKMIAMQASSEQLLIRLQGKLYLIK